MPPPWAALHVCPCLKLASARVWRGADGHFARDRGAGFARSRAKPGQGSAGSPVPLPASWPRRRIGARHYKPSGLPVLSAILMPGEGAVPRGGMSSGAASRFASLPQQGSGAPGFRALRIPCRYGRPTWTAPTARKGYKGIRDALEQCHALACPDRRIHYIRKCGTVQNA